MRRSHTRRMPSFLLVLLLLVPPAWSESQNEPNGPKAAGADLFPRPGPFTFIARVPGDIRDYIKETFRKEHALGITLMVVGTGILIITDQYLIDRAHNLGDHLGISHTNYQKTVASVNVPLLNKSLRLEGPFDSGSALYFLGDGWTDVFIAGSFLSVGLVKSDNRALQTSSQMAESIIASGTLVQFLKHITGRESPFATKTPGGTWRFFPNQYKYARNVPKYDAYPSGHLAAAMASVTVISENYPEYKFVRPLGYSLIGVLGFQMMNNGVHWVSDYPLSIAMGYSLGHMAVQKGRRGDKASSVEFQPLVFEGGAGIQATVKFSTEKKKES